MAVALQDYVAPDCRFLTIYRGQVVYVFSKLKGRGRLFWGGSVSAGKALEEMVWGWGWAVSPHVLHGTSYSAKCSPFILLGSL